MIRIRRTAGSILLLLWAVAGTVLFPAWTSDAFPGFRNSMISVAFCGAVFLLMRREAIRKPGRRRLAFTIATGLLFSVMTAFGYAIEMNGRVDFFRQAPAILVFTPILAALVSLTWRTLERTDRAKGPEEGLLARKKWLIPVILLVCWLPAFLAEYPGGFRYDATIELAQATEGNGFNGDFPLLHSALVCWLLPMFHGWTGSWNTGVTVYVVIQMTLMAAIYAHILWTLIRKGVHRYVVRYALLYCALFPVIQILVVQELRDVMFAALFTYTVFCLYLLCTEKERILGNPVKPVLCATVLSLTLLARNNNTSAVFTVLVITVNALIWWKNRKQYLRGATLWAVGGVGSFLVIGWILGIVCQPVSKPTAATSMSLLSQSVTRAWMERRDEWTAEEQETLSEYMDLENIRYIPEYADPTKGRIRVNAFKYAGFCLKMGWKYPGVYLDAVAAQTRGMWFPPAVIDGYKQYFSEEEGQPYWGYAKNYFAILPENEEPVEHLSLAPWVLDFYTWIGLQISFEQIPVISMLFSIGAQTWLAIGLFMYLWYRRKTKLLLPAGAILIYLAGNAFVPIVLLRYFAGIFLCHPMIAGFLLQPEAAQIAARE